ncbi:MAG: phytase [Bacteroidales bacterium]|nr:phytase [Bacteroidales bacterium]
MNSKYNIKIFCLLLLYVSACNEAKKTNTMDADIDSIELMQMQEKYEDSIEWVYSKNLQAGIKNNITADIETQPVESLNGDDAADDPAIWINEKDPSRSLVLGTNKKAGLYVYDLEGDLVAYRKIGRVNNVDIRDGFLLWEKEVAIVAASNRSNNCISLLYIDKATGEISDTIKNIPSDVDEVYGVCLYKDIKNNTFYVFVNGKGGWIEQWLIAGGSQISAHLVRTFTVGSQPEGMVVNDKNGMLYIGVEDEGIFKFSADPANIIEMVKLPGSDSTNANIAYDIEGIALFSYKEFDYLIASSQGNYSYTLFKLGKTDQYITSFTIYDGIIDGVEETDGLDVAVSALSSRFPEGLLVVQDGFNYNGDTLVNQNFKFISIEKLLKLL